MFHRRSLYSNVTVFNSFLLYPEIMDLTNSILQDFLGPYRWPLKWEFDLFVVC